MFIRTPLPRLIDLRNLYEAMFLRYAIEALRSRPQARFTKARRQCRNACNIIESNCFLFDGKFHKHYRDGGGGIVGEGGSNQSEE